MPHTISNFDFSERPLSAEDQRLVEAYAVVGRPFENLPYTEDFERLRVLVGGDDSDETRHELYRRLLNLEISRRLPRIPRDVGDYGSFFTHPHPLSFEDELLINAYLVAGRPLDDLPYTPEFERIRVLAGIGDSDLARHVIFKRLNRFHTAGQLPRVPMTRIAKAEFAAGEASTSLTATVSKAGNPSDSSQGK